MRSAPGGVRILTDLPDEAEPGDHYMAAVLERVKQKENKQKELDLENAESHRALMKRDWTHHDGFWAQQKQRAKVELADVNKQVNTGKGSASRKQDV